MLHDIIDEQRNCLDVRINIAGKNIFFTCFPYNL